MNGFHDVLDITLTCDKHAFQLNDTMDVQMFDNDFNVHNYCLVHIT